MTIDYKDKYGNIPVALEKADEIHAYNVNLSGVQTLPDEECIEVIIQPDVDVYLGDQTLQNILIPAGSTLILDVSNTNIITLNGSGQVRVLVLK